MRGTGREVRKTGAHTEIEGNKVREGVGWERDAIEFQGFTAHMGPAPCLLSN